MKTPQVIYIGKTIWSEENFNDSPAYFNEEAVRDLLREGQDGYFGIQNMPTEKRPQ